MTASEGPSHGRLAVAAGLAFLAAAVWFGLGMNRGLLLSSDIKSRCWPWAGVTKPVALQAQTLSDPVWQFVPYVEFARHELADGRLPFWNPHQYGGVPLLGNYVSGLASPLLAPALLLGVEAGWNLSLLLRVLAAAAAAFVWLVDLGRSRSSAAVGALAFALSGPFVAWLELPHTLVAPAVPLLLMVVRRAARRGARADLLGVAIATLLVLVGGHPEVAIFAALLAVIVMLTEAATLRRVAEVAAAAGVGALLAGPVLLPFLETWWLSAERLGANRVPQVVPLSALIRFVAPHAAAGHPIAAASTVSTLVAVAAVATAIGLYREREVRVWSVVVVGLLAAIYDNPLARLLADTTPLYFSRALLLLPLPLAALASRGLDHARRALTGRFGVRAGAGLMAGALALVGGELLWAARGVNAVTPPEELTRSTPLLERLRADHGIFRILPLHTFLPPNAATGFGLDDVRGYEALSPRGWIRVREAMGRFTGTVTVSDVLEPWNLAPGGAALDYWNVEYLLVHPQLRYTASVLNREFGLDLEEVYSGVDGRLLRNRRVQDRVRFEHGGQVERVDEVPTRWIISASLASDDRLIIANPFFPGWRASVDGRRIALRLAPGDPIVVPLRAGRHVVELVYRPFSLRLGLGLAAVGLVAAAVAIRRWPAVPG